jgi:hypothetical protein
MDANGARIISNDTPEGSKALEDANLVLYNPVPLPLGGKAQAELPSATWGSNPWNVVQPLPEDPQAVEMIPFYWPAGILFTTFVPDPTPPGFLRPIWDPAYNYGFNYPRKTAWIWENSFTVIGTISPGGKGSKRPSEPINNPKPPLEPATGGIRPPNMSPPGAGRSGAFREAKRKSGIPVSQEPSRVLPNVDKRGNVQPGRIYEFDRRLPNGQTETVRIREDADGHFFGPDDPQNRGPHFNDDEGNHYDY